MIIKTALNGHAGNLYRHLTRTDDGNERIRVVEVRGCAAEDLLGGLREMKATAAGSRCEKSFYHVSFAAPPDDAGRLGSDDAWLRCAGRFEQEFGLENHARAVVHHFKDGRWHQHVVWNRIDPETGRAAHLSHERRRAIKVARELERDLQLTHVSSDRPAQRREQRPPLQWEKEAARRTKIDADQVRDQIAGCWKGSRSGEGFAAELDARGLILARGERRPYVVVDGAGNFYALGARVLPGEKAGTIAGKLGDVAPGLPTLEQAKALQLERGQSKRYRRGEKSGEGERTLDLEGKGGPAPAAAPPGGRQFSAEHVALKTSYQREAEQLQRQQERERQALAQAHARERRQLERAKPGLLARLTGAAKRAEQARQAKLKQIEVEARAQRRAHEKAQEALRRDYEAKAGALRQQEREAAVRVAVSRLHEQQHKDKGPTERFAGKRKERERPAPPPKPERGPEFDR